MTEILAVFRSRSQAADCSSRLKSFGIPASLVNTPKEANVGCGLSLKIPQSMLARARTVISGGRYSAFYGFYSMQNLNGRIFIARIG